MTTTKPTSIPVDTGMRNFFRFQLSRYCPEIRHEFMRRLKRDGYRVYNPEKDAAQQREQKKALRQASAEVVAEIRRMRRVRKTETCNETK
jgi:hypothetical protein